MGEWVGGGGCRLCSIGSLYRALAPPPAGVLQPTRLLRSSWLLSRAIDLRAAKSHLSQLLELVGGGGGDLSTAREVELARRAICRLALPRRQELPEEAFIDAAELQRVAPISFVGEHRAPIIAVSATWRTASHPDPLGE